MCEWELYVPKEGRKEKEGGGEGGRGEKCKEGWEIVRGLVGSVVCPVHSTGAQGNPFDR